HFSLRLLPLPPRSTLFPYTTLFRSLHQSPDNNSVLVPVAEFRVRPVIPEIKRVVSVVVADGQQDSLFPISRPHITFIPLLEQGRSEEHTSELQSRGHLVCRLLLEKK